MKLLQETYDLLQSPKKIIITFHQRPDADAMGGALGLYNFLIQLNHQVNVISPNNWASWLSWMDGIEAVVDFEAKTSTAIELFNNAELIFCLDFNRLNRTKKIEPLLRETKQIKILIDHHQEPEVEEFAYGISNVDSSSTSELCYDYICGYDKKYLNKAIAQCLYAGLVGDTGSFSFSNTTAKVHSIVADLMNNGLDHIFVQQQLFDNFLENRLRFLGHLLSQRLEFFYEYNTALIRIPKRDVFKFELKPGDTEGIVNYPLSVKGIKLAALVIDREENERKWSFRSQNDFDCNTFAKKYFNGGGHINAAGGNTTDGLDETIKKFLIYLEENKQFLQ